MIVAGKDQIQGWKEIAAYLARDERTVKRWEKQRGLPVRRIPGAGRANVYILVAELEVWLVSGSPSSEEVSGKDVSGEEASGMHPEEFAGERPERVEDPEELERRGEQKLAADSDRGLLGHAVSGGLPGDVIGQERIVAAEAQPELTAEAKPPLRWRGWMPSLVALAGLLLIFFLALAATRFHERTLRDAAAQRGSERIAAASRNATNRQMCLQGVYLYEARTPASLEQARHSFETVIARDAGFAPAYAGLANTFLLLREYSMMPGNEAYERARAAAERALALDPDLPDAHTALGFILFFHDGETARAKSEFETALRLNPRSALAHHWYGSMLTHQARYAEALEQLDAAQSLQPSSPAILASRAFAFGLGGHRNEASDTLQALVDAKSGNGSLHRTLAILSLAQPRDLPRYLREMRAFEEMRKNSEELRTLREAEEAFAAHGETELWRVFLATERRQHPRPERPSYRMAEAESALGMREQALADLERLTQLREPLMIGIALDPLFDSLRGEERFERVLDTMGLEPGR